MKICRTNGPFPKDKFITFWLNFDANWMRIALAVPSGVNSIRN